MKKIFILLLTILFLFNLDVYAVKDNINFVMDDANILSDETEDVIKENSSFLQKKFNVDYYVITVKNIKDNDLEEYTDLIYEYYDLSDNGILILVSYKDKMFRIKVGENLSNKINNETIDKYIELYFMPFLKKSEWDSGIKNGYLAFYKLLSDIYDFDSDDVEVYEDVDFVLKYKDIIFLIAAWLNTVIAYVFCKYFINIYQKNSKFNIRDSLLFGIILFINILLLVFIYNIDIIACIFVFLIELGAIYSNIVSINKMNDRKDKKKTIKNTNELCYNKKQGGKHEKKRSR